MQSVLATTLPFVNQPQTMQIETYHTLTENGMPVVVANPLLMKLSQPSVKTNEIYINKKLTFRLRNNDIVHV